MNPIAIQKGNWMSQQISGLNQVLEADLDRNRFGNALYSLLFFPTWAIQDGKADFRKIRKIDLLVAELKAIPLDKRRADYQKAKASIQFQTSALKNIKAATATAIKLKIVAASCLMLCNVAAVAHFLPKSLGLSPAAQTVIGLGKVVGVFGSAAAFVEIYRKESNPSFVLENQLLAMNYQRVNN